MVDPTKILRDAKTASSSTPFSRSVLWKYLRQFYDTEGVNAWAAKVPNYVTSNPYIANSYAQIIIRFIQDCLYDGTYNPSDPVYIIELGAGSGIFSFYTIKRLVELQSALRLSDVNLVYVMTDFTVSNIHHWQSHPALQPYIQKGCLDFAQFDIETSTEIHLMNSGRVIAPVPEDTAKNPVILIANYVFDSIPQDLFQLANGKLKEGRIAFTLQTPPQPSTVASLENLDVQWSYHDITLPYYHEPDLDAVLKEYAGLIPEGYFYFPITGLRCIQRWQQLSNQRLCLLISDVGYPKFDSFAQTDDPPIHFHESFFYAPFDLGVIARYIAQIGGDFHHSFTEQALDTSIFLVGMSLKNLPETNLAVETFLDSFGHTTIYRLYEHIDRTRPFLTVETFLTFAASTRWDPLVFDTSLEFLLQEIGTGEVSPHVINNLVSIVEQVAANYYHSPSANDTFFNIGMLLQEVNLYEKALSYYQLSLDYYGKTATTLYNMGLCHFFLDRPQLALALLHEAVELNPQYVLARGWIAQIEHEHQTAQTTG